MKFAEVLDILLREMERNPGIAVEELLRRKAAEFGLTDDDVEEIELANGLIDSFDRTVGELNEARREGVSRSRFMGERLGQTIEKADEERREAFVKAIEDAGREQSEQNF